MESAPIFTTLITTTDYAPGVVCLAQSLVLVKSTAVIHCWVTSAEVEDAILQADRLPNNIVIKHLPNETVDTFFRSAADIDQSLFIDAPRRSLFKMGEPFIFLDADMICLHNIDDLFDLLKREKSVDWVPGTVYAVPNFRNKKKSYNDGTGNFNAGLMVMPDPQPEDYAMMTRMLAAGYNDTEEKLLNDIFKGRWIPLPIAYNCQKRCFRLAPPLWNELRASGIYVMHYVGGKPWQDEAQLEKTDWEKGKAYEALFEVWHRIRRGHIQLDADGISYINTECPESHQHIGQDLNTLVPAAAEFFS